MGREPNPTERGPCHIEEYGLLADLLEEWNRAYSEDLAVADTILRQRKVNRVLEFGCGEGRCLTYLHEHGYDVSGIDRSPHKIARARARLGDHLSLYCQDICRPILGKWDAVLMLGGFISYWPAHEDIDALWKIVRSVLGIKGTVVFSWEEWCGDPSGGNVETQIVPPVPVPGLRDGIVVDSYDPNSGTNDVAYTLDLGGSELVRFSFRRRLLSRREILQSLHNSGFSHLTSTQLTYSEDCTLSANVREWVSVAVVDDRKGGAPV